jgi:hypothetical protein
VSNRLLGLLPVGLWETVIQTLNAFELAVRARVLALEHHGALDARVLSCAAVHVVRALHITTGLKGTFEVGEYAVPIGIAESAIAPYFGVVSNSRKRVEAICRAKVEWT